MISLSQAKALVLYLEAENQDAANQLLLKLFLDANKPLLNEIGKFTRDIHNSILGLQLDASIQSLTSSDIPNAMERLHYVLEKTDSAVNRTMDAVEIITPLIESIQVCFSRVHIILNQLASGKIEIDNFKALYPQIDALLEQMKNDSQILNHQINVILMAQDFQDLTGQVINQVITLFKNIEIHLVNILTTFKTVNEKVSDQQDKSLVAEGPIVNEKLRAEKQVMESQDEVDDLLSSLGF